MESTVTPEAQDIDWMRRVKAGDREAFGELVDAHQTRVLGTVMRMLGPETMDAEDIAQQVFLRVWKSAARYAPTAKFTTWLFTITRNLVFNESRRRKNRPTSSLDAPVAGSDDESIARQFADDSASSPEAALLEREMAETIDSAIAELPEQQRLAVILRRYEEMPYEDIARVLDLTVPAVKSLLFRARTFLRERLEKYLAQ
jgi:RNA polymerase sigma-70 factor (ECF subfamily)